MFYAARSCCLEMGVELQIEKGPPYDFFQVARESEKVGMCVLEVMMVYSGNTYDSAKPEYLLKSVARHFRKHIPLWVR